MNPVDWGCNWRDSCHVRKSAPAILIPAIACTAAAASRPAAIPRTAASEALSPVSTAERQVVVAGLPGVIPWPLRQTGRAAAFDCGSI